MDLKKFKHIIWDWNGTILDDVDLCVDIMNGILKRNSLPKLSVSKYRDIFTFPVRDYYEKTGLDFSRNSFEVLGKEFIDDYEKRRNSCSLHEGVLDVLRHFKFHDYSQSILSAYSHDTLLEALNHYLISNYFDMVAGLDNIYAGSKLNNGKKLVEEINIPPDKILLIGDTTHDYEVAAELGINCILISHGHQTHGKLGACGVPVIDNFSQLLNGIRNS